MRDPRARASLVDYGKLAKVELAALDLPMQAPVALTG